MRKDKHLYKIMSLAVSWFLFVTTPLAFLHAYESPIQSSPFLQEVSNTSYVSRLLETKDHQKNVLLWKLKFGGRSFQTDGNIRSEAVGFQTSGRLRVRLLQNMDFRAKANVNMISARTQSLFGDNEGESRIYLNNAYLDFSPIDDFISINVGVIGQSWWNNDMFIDGSLGFPGAKQSLAYKKGDFSIAFVAQQLIPTSNTLSTQTNEVEQIPTLFTESIEAYYGISDWNWIKGRLTYFQYNDLPAIVAYNSQIRFGNSILPGSGLSQVNAEFIHPFRGILAQATFEQKLSRYFAAQLSVDYVKNLAASKGTDESNRILLGTTYDAGTWLYSPAVEYYYSEPDAVPGAYAGAFRGHNNRVGQGFQFGLENADWGVLFKANYYRSQLINESGIATGVQQDDQQTFLLTVETAYDFI